MPKVCLPIYLLVHYCTQWCTYRLQIVSLREYFFGIPGYGNTFRWHCFAVCEHFMGDTFHFERNGIPWGAIFN